MNSVPADGRVRTTTDRGRYLSTAIASGLLACAISIIASAPSAWTTVDRTTFPGSSLHGAATAGIGIVLAAASILLLVGRARGTACTIGVLTCLVTVIAATDDITAARRVPGDAGDSSITVIIHPALWITLWAGAIGVVLALAGGVPNWARLRGLSTTAQESDGT